MTKVTEAHRAELIALAERCEAAGAGEQEELLEYAWLLVNCEHETPDDSDEMMGLFDRLRAMLAAEAYESAALALVPPSYRLGDLNERNSGDFGCALFPRDFLRQFSTYEAYVDTVHENTIWRGAAPTPALAIAAASLRARAGERE